MMTDSLDNTPTGTPRVRLVPDTAAEQQQIVSSDSLLRARVIRHSIVPRSIDVRFERPSAPINRQSEAGTAAVTYGLQLLLSATEAHLDPDGCRDHYHRVPVSRDNWSSARPSDCDTIRPTGLELLFEVASPDIPFDTEEQHHPHSSIPIVPAQPHFSSPTFRDERWDRGVDTSSSTNWRSAAVVTPTDDASLLGTKGDPLPPLSSAVAFLAGKLEHVCIICPTIPHNVDWKNGLDVNKLFQHNPMTVYGRKQVPQCLLQDAATVRDKAIVTNWWVGLKKEEKREEYKALQKIYNTPSKNNSKVNDVPPPRRRNEARPNQPPVNDEIVYGGLGDTSEIRAASSSQLASCQANNMYKGTNRKRKKNEPARGPSDMYDSAVRKKMSIVERRTNEVNALVTFQVL
uniref:Uncharacterized protein n=1 Tax=Attheya septentrionalis TaxID=420275 RepID=A0A7S2ULD3_9STRA|mmetsp:Transcript_34/g.59  ORF Transcript_34/g.59 Transcript_34/m.59 type:complete len:402 (+) Transcript_34:44-1249(+)